MPTISAGSSSHAHFTATMPLPHLPLPFICLIADAVDWSIPLSADGDISQEAVEASGLL